MGFTDLEVIGMMSEQLYCAEASAGHGPPESESREVTALLRMSSVTGRRENRGRLWVKWLWVQESEKMSRVREPRAWEESRE